MTQTAVILNTIKWWKSKRPVHWSEAEHLAQPIVNCRGEFEYELAQSVADYVKERKNG